ncbi:MAG TPA: hypothetical protein VHO24_01975 [Opitutaceae bacterium]|nr:hypothetical protein [Opitutaceae bacterium]
MPRRFALAVTLFAWLLATGGHWDVAQTFAWGRMFATNSQTMSLADAAKKTFSVEGRCDLCKKIARAKTHQDCGDEGVPRIKPPEKVLLASLPPAAVFLAPAPLHLGLLPSIAALASAEPVAPLLTPPRSLA